MESGKRTYKSRSDKGGNFKGKSNSGKFQHKNGRDDDKPKSGRTFGKFRKDGIKSEDKPERSYASKRFRDDTVKHTDKPVRKISISKTRNEDETSEAGSKKIIKVFSKDKPYSKDRSSFRSERPSFRKEISASKADDGRVRLNKIIASSGICSRREADDMIKAGLVSVNGVVITELGTKVLPTEDIRYNGERMKKERLVYILLNKPKDYVTTMKDPNAKRTVMELIRGACKERVYPVGQFGPEYYRCAFAHE